MIQFSLKCKDGHQFDSWFQSSDAFEKLLGAGIVSCAICGIADVEKSLMAPRVSTSRGKSGKPLSAPATPAEQKLADMRRDVEQNSEYVGMKFANEARAMHDGEAPNRAIYGEAKPAEAKKLIEDGVPILPLPFMPGRKTN